MKMKRICGLVLCFGVIYVTTASIIATRIASIITGDGDYTDKSTLRQVHVVSFLLMFEIVMTICVQNSIV